MRKAPPARMTAAEFERHWDDNGFELIDGVLTERSTGAYTSEIQSHLGYLVSAAAKFDETGSTFDASCPYHCFPWKPDDVRKADISFVRRERMRQEDIPEGMMSIPPDLSIEVVDRTENLDALEIKVSDFLRAGTKLLWIVYPERRRIQVRTADGSIREFRADEELTGDPVLPGFRVRVADLFPPVDS